MDFKVRYDDSLDILTVVAPGFVTHSSHEAGGFIIDFLEDGTVRGIEIHYAMKVFEVSANILSRLRSADLIATRTPKSINIGLRFPAMEKAFKKEKEFVLPLVV